MRGAVGREGIVYDIVRRGCPRRRPWTKLRTPELEFLKSLWGLGTEEEEGFRTGPPGYIGWRNSLLGINSGAP